MPQYPILNQRLASSSAGRLISIRERSRDFLSQIVPLRPGQASDAPGWILCREVKEKAFQIGSLKVNLRKFMA